MKRKQYFISLNSANVITSLVQQQVNNLKLVVSKF